MIFLISYQKNGHPSCSCFVAKKKKFNSISIYSKTSVYLLRSFEHHTIADDRFNFFLI